MNLCTPYAIPNQIAFSGIMKRMNIKLYGPDLFNLQHTLEN